MSNLPKTYRKIEATKVSADFRNITRIVSAPIKTPVGDQVLVQQEFVGINASDINYTAGKYIPGIKAPFDCGLEAIGTVVAVGENVKKLKVGDAVTTTAYGAFAEYQLVKEKSAIKVPFVDASILPLLVSGLTASIALEQTGQIVKGETVLVTAAAGGTGLFAIQLAKLAGCHVIGTCSSPEKVDVLKRLGCDRVIDYKKESLHNVLKQEYPKGVDVVYESVGGEFFDICARNLAVKGRLIIIGFISGYKDQSGWSGSKSQEKEQKRAGPPLPVLLLGKSASVRGFFLNDYVPLWSKHATTLASLFQQGKIKSFVDEKKFVGLEQVADAIDYMYSGQNIGKVVVNVRAPKSKL